ncbi:unnamed protein product, partial [Ectocarpus fasciculatus]
IDCGKVAKGRTDAFVGPLSLQVFPVTFRGQRRICSADEFRSVEVLRGFEQRDDCVLTSVVAVSEMNQHHGSLLFACDVLIPFGHRRFLPVSLDPWDCLLPNSGVLGRLGDQTPDRPTVP